MLASDVNNTNFVGAQNPDSLLYVKFYMKSEQDVFKSEKEGRPIFYEIPYIKIMTPGNQLTEVDVPARKDHELRFPIQWAQFKNSQSQDLVIGTPVEEWPALTKSQAEELKGLKFFSVEQIAQASDQQAQRLGMNGPMLRQKAQAFLMAAKDSALEQKQAVELAKKDEQIADLNQRIARLEQLLMADKQSVQSVLDKPKRKYTKRKVEELPVGEEPFPIEPKNE